MVLLFGAGSEGDISLVCGLDGYWEWGMAAFLSLVRYAGVKALSARFEAAKQRFPAGA